MELEQLTARMPENPRENVRTALSWMVAAYYEHLKGRWTEEHTQKQIHEAEKLMETELMEWNHTKNFSDQRWSLPRRAGLR